MYTFLTERERERQKEKREGDTNIILFLEVSMK
jgi:hypothetical protein